MRFLSKLTDYHPSDHVYLTTKFLQNNWEVVNVDGCNWGTLCTRAATVSGTEHELASNMRFLSELTDYRPSNQVYLTTIIVAEQLGGCKLVGPKRGSFTFYTRARRVGTDSGPRPDGQSEQAPTVWTHLWMKVNWFHIWFHLGSPLCKN
jgi:hypothetical protein